ncbi:MAG TPA: hypothetical protein VFR55_08560 [Dehalococcoidia bacterium]|nr:hypothetical protein [Dehalococcoidia bacterium]
MQITRIYPGADGQSHFEDREIDNHPTEEIAASASNFSTVLEF